MKTERLEFHVSNFIILGKESFFGLPGFKGLAEGDTIHSINWTCWDVEFLKENSPQQGLHIFSFKILQCSFPLALFNWYLGDGF